MSSAPGHCPTRRNTSTTGLVQESVPLHSGPLQEDQDASMMVGDPANIYLAMIGTWATEKSHNVDLGLIGHVGSNHGSTSHGVDGDSINCHQMISHCQHTSIGPSFPLLNPKQAEMQRGSSHQPVPNGTPTTGVSHSAEATSSEPRRAYLDPMQRWVDENAEEEPWKSLRQKETMNNLANTLGDQGQLDQAAKMKEVLEKMRRILCEEQPYTKRAEANMVRAMQIQNHGETRGKCSLESCEICRLDTSLTELD